MTFCRECGAKLQDNEKFCAACGAKRDNAADVQSQPQAEYGSYTGQSYAQPAYTEQGYNKAPQQAGAAGYSQPMSTWGYLGSLLLMAIPLAGFIITIVWAAGGTQNPHRRNLARGMLVFMLIAAVLYALIFAVIGTLIAGLFTQAFSNGDFPEDFSHFFNDMYSFDGMAAQFYTIRALLL